MEGICMSRLAEPGLAGPSGAVADGPAWGAGPLGPWQRPSVFTFTNPLYRGADPWVVQRGGMYYLCQAGPGGRMEVWKSPTLTERGSSSLVWAPPLAGWNRAQIW